MWGAAAIVGFLTGLAVGSVAAGNFGSNTNSADEVAHTCDTSPELSQCVANNGGHLVYKVNLTQPVSLAVSDAIAKANAIRDFSAEVWSTNNIQDVNAHDGDYGNTEWWAYTACTPAAVHGGTAPAALWCKPQDNVFNYDHPAQWDTNVSGRQTVACHELGHSFGLRHTVDATSCMRNGQVNPPNYSDHDVQRVNGNY